MKEIRINIPTKKDFKNVFGWVFHRNRMKKNTELLNELYKEIENEICSGYWRNDISTYMKAALFGANGKIRALFCEKKRELI